MIRTIFSIAAAMGVPVLLATATTAVRVDGKAPLVQAETREFGLTCHTASWRDAFSPDTVRAGYIDARDALQAGLLRRACLHQ